MTLGDNVTDSVPFLKNDTAICWFWLLGSRVNSHLCFVMPRGWFHDVHQSVVQRQQWRYLLGSLFFLSCCSRCCSRNTHLTRSCCPGSCPSTSPVMPFLPCRWICLVLRIEQKKVQLFQQILIFLSLYLFFTTELPTKSVQGISMYFLALSSDLTTLSRHLSLFLPSLSFLHCCRNPNCDIYVRGLIWR